MPYTDQQLNRIFDRTDGKCHLCGKKLAWCNYGSPDGRGRWEVDHSVPRVHGDSNHGRNLFAACTSCNRSKRDGCTPAERAKNGLVKALLSRHRKARIRKNNAAALGIIGAGMGLIAGPAAAVVLALAGATIGHEIDPEA